MTIPASEHESRAGASEGATVGDAVAGGGDRSARGRGELGLLSASERGSHAIAGAVAGRSHELGRARDASQPRRLRLAAPVQLELVSGWERPRPEVVWASLPERARETVLVLLARLIGSGAVEELEGA